MTICQIFLAVLACGAIGGFLNSLMPGEGDRKDKPIERIAELLKDVGLGSGAAVVVWALYGPMTSVDLAQVIPDVQLHFTILQMAVLLLTGMAGKPILTILRERHATQAAQGKLADALGQSQKKQNDLAAEIRTLQAMLPDKFKQEQSKAPEEQ